MDLYPAIDLKGGRCVRLMRGDLAAATVYNDDPGAQAADFAAQGCRWIHVVDLDGAVAGAPVNTAAVAAILAAGPPVQLGGGVRSLARIEAWLAAGVARVVLGTVALTDPDLVRAACRAFPGRIAIGIDARGGRVATQGWLAASDVTALDLARALEDAGAAALIFTDIDRDGALGGVNLEATLVLAAAVATPVIASGGVSGPEDLARLTAAGDGRLAGVIVGRALYEGRLDVRSALAILAPRSL